MASDRRWGRRARGIAAALAMLVALGQGRAEAQAGAAAAPDGEAGACELHIWPTDEIDSRSSGWLSLFGLVGTAIDRVQAASGDRRRRDAIAELLDPATQLRLIAGTDPSHLLPIARSRLVLHDRPVSSGALRAARTRQVPSASPCYAELHVRRIFFRRSATGGRTLVAGFALRRFGADGESAERLEGEGERSLTDFPPRDEAGAAAAAEDLRLGFAGAFRSFAVGLLVRTLPAR